MNNDLFNVDDLLSEAFKPKESLKELFLKKLDELKMTITNISNILEIPYRTLNGILDGTQKILDVTNLIKLADFIQIPKEDLFSLYMDAVEKKFPIPKSSSEKIKFIKENFDLTVLKKAKLIDSVTDFEHIENRINARLGYKSIFEYKKPNIDVAFSSGLFKPKNILTRLFWIRTAICTLEEIDSPYSYNRQALIEFFPRIRWHSLNETMGLTEVIKALYKVGITVIYQPPLQGLQLRGATFNVNDKPCIVLTNYQGFYSTLWFCLIHELYHVIFDWDDIKNDCYHLTDDDNRELTVREREKQADEFARKYLFPDEKMGEVKHRLNDINFIKEYAAQNHVHHSIVYAFNAFINNNDRKAWARVKRYSPNISEAIKNIDYSWINESRIETVVSQKKAIVYN